MFKTEVTYHETRQHFQKHGMFVRTDILLGGVLSADAEANDEDVVHRGGHHVQLPGGVDVGQQLLVERVRAAQAEADQAQLRQQTVEDSVNRTQQGSIHTSVSRLFPFLLDYTYNMFSTFNR